jgi:hypothetical protein
MGLDTKPAIVFHPRDLVPVLQKQLSGAKTKKPRIVNFGGGVANSMSLAQLNNWCAQTFWTSSSREQSRATAI